MSSVAHGAGDVLWSLGFLLRYSWAILALAAIPATHRIVAALHPDEPRVYSWPVEALVAALRLATAAVVLWLGWRADAALRRRGLDSPAEVIRAIGAYAWQDWLRLLTAACIASTVFLLLNLFSGPVLSSVVGHVTEDARVVDAWGFGIRNLLIIPLFYAFAYGLLRPALLAPAH